MGLIFQNFWNLYVNIFITFYSENYLVFYTTQTHKAEFERSTQNPRVENRREFRER